jgi:hypothetical protein
MECRSILPATLASRGKLSNSIKAPLTVTFVEGTRHEQQTNSGQCSTKNGEEIQIEN